MSYTDIIFCFCFLPIYIILTAVLPDARRKNLMSVVMSAVFIIWARPVYYLVILAVVLIVYSSARICEGGKYKALFIAANVISPAVSLVLAWICGSGGTLKGYVQSAGFFLFAMRTLMYLKESKDGAEKDFLNCAVYLMSFEFMAISPLYSYKEISGEIKSRKITLSLLSAGLERYICGLGAVVLLGYRLEALTSAALFDGVLPVGDLILGVLFGVVGIYVNVIGYLNMSEGLLLMGGYRIPLECGHFLPKSLVCPHVGSIAPTYQLAFEKLTDGVSPVYLAIYAAVICVISGVSWGIGAGAMALIGIICAAMLLQKLFEVKGSASSAVFTVLAFAAAFIMSISGSLNGFAGIITRIANADYIFSYAFFSLLPKGIIFITAAIVYVSPVRPILGATKRMLMTKENTYRAVRIACTALITLLLVFSAVAMISAI